MAAELARLRDHRHIGDIRQNLMVGIEIVANRETKESFPPGKKIGQRVIDKVQEKGIILRPLGDVIVLMPPLSSTEEEIQNLVLTTAWAINAVLNGKA